jgi:hypothetical protein
MIGAQECADGSYAYAEGSEVITMGTPLGRMSTRVISRGRDGVEDEEGGSSKLDRLVGAKTAWAWRALVSLRIR